ncbi:MAG: hypothetical protein J3K34DRAFT_444371 [Monoraphidium minutum]|nr:MAG: hypothetical protein J3K34DRAFT_444371 [Monoraphidium minutum]
MHHSPLHRPHRLGRVAQRPLHPGARAHAISRLGKSFAQEHTAFPPVDVEHSLGLQPFATWPRRCPLIHSTALLVQSTPGRRQRPGSPPAPPPPVEPAIVALSTPSLSLAQGVTPPQGGHGRHYISPPKTCPLVARAQQPHAAGVREGAGACSTIRWVAATVLWGRKPGPAARASHNRHSEGSVLPAGGSGRALSKRISAARCNEPTETPEPVPWAARAPAPSKHSLPPDREAHPAARARAASGVRQVGWGGAPPARSGRGVRKPRSSVGTVRRTTP